MKDDSNVTAEAVEAACSLAVDLHGFAKRLLESGETKESVVAETLARAEERLGGAGSTSGRAEEVVELIVSTLFDQRQKESKLQRYEAVLAASQIGIWEWDPRTGANSLDETGCNLLGFEAEELAEVSRGSFANLVHPDDRVRVEEAVAGHIIGETDFFEVELRMGDGSGGWRWIVDRGRVTEFDEEGRPAKLLGTIEDISARKEVEAATERLQRLESLGVLAGGIAHDFNNMLVGLQGGVSLAYECAEPDGEVRSHLELAVGSLDRAKGLTRQLLTFASGGEPVRERANIVTLVEESARFDLAGSQVDFHLNVEDEPWPVHVDVGQVQQVFSNLFLNARNAMSGVGTVRVEIANLDSAESDGRFVRVVFEDDGPGIAEELRDRVFDPYFTTRDEGTGLGLASAQSIMKRHGGRIELVPSDEGATFEVLVPALTNVGRATRKMLSATADQPSAISMRVLIIDDEPSVRSVAERMFRRLGHEVVSAGSAEEGIELYRSEQRGTFPFDIVLLDITLPGGMSGREAAAEILEEDPGAVLIASTGYSEDPVLADPGAFGFCGRLPKPYSLAELRDAVREALLNASK